MKKKNDNAINGLLILIATIMAVGIIAAICVGIGNRKSISAQKETTVSETIAVITDTIETTTAITSGSTTTTETTNTTATETTTTTTESSTTVTDATTTIASTTTTVTTTVIETDPPTPPMPEEEVYEEEIVNNDTFTLTLTSVDQMTYYSGKTGCKGASGRQLLNDYSVACNSIPLGTIVHIESSDGFVCGEYRVDDTGGMPNNVIDIFYSSYDNVPSSFRISGRVSCTVWIVE